MTKETSIEEALTHGYITLAEAEALKNTTPAGAARILGTSPSPPGRLALAQALREEAADND